MIRRGFKGGGSPPWYVFDTPRYLENTWGVQRHRPKLVRSQKPKYLQTPRAGMGPIPRDISKIPGVSSVTSRNLSEAKSQSICRHPGAGMGPTPRDISKIPRGVGGHYEKQSCYRGVSLSETGVAPPYRNRT